MTWVVQANISSAFETFREKSINISIFTESPNIPPISFDVTAGNPAMGNGKYLITPDSALTSSQRYLPTISTEGEPLKRKNTCD